MSTREIIVTIIVALIGMAGASCGTIFGYRQFLIKRQDEKEEKTMQSKIEDAVKDAKVEIYKELAKVSEERSQEGAIRFSTHAKALEEVNKQIDSNTKQINELTQITKNVLESMDALGKVVKASAESQRNANYDRILVVANRVLANKKMTITEKTNLKQLYNSWKDLNGEDAKVDTLYEECMKVEIIPDGERAVC